MNKINFDQLDLTSDFILSYISEKDIFDRYVNQPYKLGQMIKSNLRDDDSTASLNIFIKNGQLRYKDFGHSYGDCFEFVKQLYNCSYTEALKIIAKDFNLKQGIHTTEKIQKKPLPAEIAFEKSIIPIKRGWKKIDLDYWSRYNITIPLLVEYDIFACNHVYLKNRPDNMYIWGTHLDDNPIYCYKIGNKFKCYRPLTKDKKAKWLSTHKEFDIQGLKQLPRKGNLCIITSSMKDVLVLKVLGYNAIALGGEGNNIPDKVLDYLYACFDKIVIFYDNDKAGIMYAKILSEKINVSYIHIPIECEDQKDISDFVEAYSIEEGDKLMKELL